MSTVKTHEQREKYTVDGFSREVHVQKYIPNEILVLIKIFAHNEFNHLYELNGDVNKWALQKEMLRDVSEALLKVHEVYGLEDRHIQICSHSLNISTYYILSCQQCSCKFVSRDLFSF
eukprot:130658_1